MIRVAFDTTPLRLGGGGVATYARELQSAFATRTDVELVDVHHERTGVGSTAARIAAGIDREARFYPRGLATRARAASADLIHVPAAMPAYSNGIPLVLTIHDAIPWRHPEWFTRANALQQRLLVGRAARKADLILTDSHASKSDIVELLGVDASRVEVIHLGISPAFSPANRDRDWMAERHGINGPIVLSVGTPEPRKNLLGTIEIFERVARDVPEASLMLVGGDGWGADAISARIAASPRRIIRTGRVDFEDLIRLYASADCFLFPSLLEGFGFPPLEAMASGTPVVCSDRPSLPEVVGDAALTAAPDDTEALVRCVTQALGDRSVAATLRERGLAQSASFSWARTADQTVAAYRRALAK
jgi:alpha-1,3-rhamnosyl/mannosyltransferase